MKMILHNAKIKANNIFICTVQVFGKNQITRRMENYNVRGKRRKKSHYFGTPYENYRGIGLVIRTPQNRQSIKSIQFSPRTGRLSSDSLARLQAVRRQVSGRQAAKQGKRDHTTSFSMK